MDLHSNERTPQSGGKVDFMETYTIETRELNDYTLEVVFSALAEDEETVIFSLTCIDSLPYDVKDVFEEGGSWEFIPSYDETERVEVGAVTACKLMCYKHEFRQPDYMREVGDKEVKMLVDDLTSEYPQYEDDVRTFVEHFIETYAINYGVNGILKFFIG